MACSEDPRTLILLHGAIVTHRAYITLSKQLDPLAKGNMADFIRRRDDLLNQRDDILNKEWIIYLMPYYPN